MSKRKTLLFICLLMLGISVPAAFPRAAEAKYMEWGAATLAKASKPVIEKEPSKVTVAAGKTAVFKVEASGKNLQYQWYYQKPGSEAWTAVTKNGTAAEYKLVVEERHNGYRYRCVVSNSAGKVTSAEAKLTVIYKPSITSQPKSLSIKSGTEAVFKVTAEGGALKYQWYYQKPGETAWTAVSNGGNAAAYKLTVRTRHDGYKYKCEVKNSQGNVTSKKASLTVLTMPAVTSQPKSVTADIGTKVEFKVKATGGKLKYQWYYKKPGSDTWTAVTAASGKTACYALTLQDRHDGYQYKCVVSNTLGKVTSRTVKITILRKPEITTQPKSVTVTPGETASFTVKATGGSLNYQWQYRIDGEEKWADCSISNGAQTSSYSVAVQERHGTYSYRCVISNPKGSVKTKVVRITVLGTPVTDFESGSIVLANGQEFAKNTKVRSAMYPMKGLSFTWKSSPEYKYRIFYYDSDYNLLKYSALKATGCTIRAEDVEGAAYFRILLQSSDGDKVLEPGFTLPKGYKILAASGPVETSHDEPKNQGVRNLLKRADQILNLTFTTKAVLPNQKGDIAEGTTVTGVTYSSVRTESLYVPQCVSFDTYMTALMNPNSYVYTRISSAPNSRTYYGSVCSAFISYCYGMTCVHTTTDLPELEAFTAAEHQDLAHLEIGDMLLCHNGTTNHTMFVYDITRDPKGKVINVIFAHQGTPTAYTYAVTPQGFTSLLGGTKYKIYKFNDWDLVTYEESQWVSVSGEGEKDPQWNHYLGPRRGDKANWPLGETVEIDILKRADYTAAQLYRGEELIGETDIAETDLLSYEDLETGEYKVCLTDGTDRSDFCYFNVVSSQISVEDLGDGRAKVSFSSDCGTPSWYAWCSSTGTDRQGSVKSIELTEEDLENGYAVSEYAPGTWMFKVEFTNEFGTFSSSFVTAEIS